MMLVANSWKLEKEQASGWARSLESEPEFAIGRSIQSVSS